MQREILLVIQASRRHAVSTGQQRRYIVIKQGERGASLYDGKRFYMVPSERVERVVDTTAAGDTFSAAMTLEYLRGADIKSAIRYGAAAAAITVSREGASSSIPTLEEVIRFVGGGRR